MKDNINFASIHCSAVQCTGWISNNWTGCIGQCARGGKNKYTKLTFPLLNVETKIKKNTNNNI